jgi:hypothetical protein
VVVVVDDVVDADDVMLEVDEDAPVETVVFERTCFIDWMILLTFPVMYACTKIIWGVSPTIWLWTAATVQPVWDRRLTAEPT